MQKIQHFFIQSYHSDRIAFYFEMISFVFTVAASLTMAITADSPRLEYIYPGFLVGSTTQCYASYRRGAAWVMLLTGYFACINVFGFGRALAWW